MPIVHTDGDIRDGSRGSTVSMSSSAASFLLWNTGKVPSEKDL
jgi:hypothetical protein